MRALLTIVAAALLAGCGQQPEAQKPRQTIRVRSAEQDRLHKLNDLDRAIAFKRAIYASGFVCKRIERSAFVREYGNLSMWMASCADKRDWAIFVGPDATVQVRDCKDAEELKLPKCILRPRPSAAN